MLTVNLHGIGRHTRRLGPGISIYLKSVGCSISLLDCTDVQSTQCQHQISYAVVLIDGVCDPFIIVLEVYGLFLLATGIVVCNTTVHEDLGETSRGIPDEQSLELRNLVRNSFLLSMGCIPLCFLIMSYSVSTVIIILIK